MALTLLIGAAAAPAAAHAQGRANDVGGFYALIYTPAGALPPVVYVKTVRDSTSIGWAAIRYGRYKYRDDTLRFANYGVSGEVRVWRRVFIGGTYAYRTCNTGCSGLNMGSVDLSGGLLHKPGVQRDDADTEIGWQLSGGYGKAVKADISAWSIVGFLPMTVMLPQAYEGKLILSLVPGIGYGSTSDNAASLFPTAGTYASVRFMLGAGVGYVFPKGLSLHVAVHRIAVEESTTQLGLVAAWRY